MKKEWTVQKTGTPIATVDDALAPECHAYPTEQELRKTMRKSVVMAFVASSLLLLSEVTGKAATFWDIDLFFKYLSDETTAYTYRFDIKGKYDPALETVSVARAWFLVEDDWSRDSKEKVAVDLENQRFVGPSNASLNLLGGQISSDALLTLATTGTLKFTIRRTEGDFLAKEAKLEVETRPRVVPDGGATLMLLGVALAGIESLRRRMARRNWQPRRT